jgi:hypothetical protein
MCETARRELLAAIAAAFGDVQREDGVSLHEAYVIDNYGTEEERAEARALDTDQHWWEVPDADLEESYSALSFYDEKGFRYYLPAYMTWALRVLDQPNANTTSLDSLLFDLTPCYGLFEERIKLLSPEQCKAVCRFLQYLVRYGHDYDEVAQGSLDRYWNTFDRSEV